MTRKINLRTHKDPTGMTAKQAIAEAELLFTKHPTLGVVFKGSVLNASVFACGGQAMYGGAKATRGCGHNHLQPCPGGPLVYRIERLYGALGMAFNVIESTGDSWRDALDKITTKRAEEHRRYEEMRAEQVKQDAAAKKKRAGRRAR